MTSGLRERKKLRTRERISDVATQLFLERGFERTTIAEVAGAADVARMTVTNYFPLKEDLVFDRHDDVIGLLADAVRARTPGVSVHQAVRDAYAAKLEQRDPILGFIGADFARMIESSSALLARERTLHVLQEAELSAALHELGGWSRTDLRPAFAAAGEAGVFRVLHAEGRRRLLAGESTTGIVRALRAAAERLFAALEPALPEPLRTTP